MGEAIIITAIEVIVQNRPDINLDRTLLQMDFEYSESKIKGSIFIDSQEFFQKLTASNKAI